MQQVTDEFLANVFGWSNTLKTKVNTSRKWS
jgi:hypothetical protein